MGDRFIEFFYADGRQSVYMKYDPEEYPEEMRTRLTDPERDFKREFEPKNNPVENTQKEPTNKGCGDCANFTNEDVNGNGYCEAFKSEQSCGTCRCQEYKPKN